MSTEPSPASADLPASGDRAPARRGKWRRRLLRLAGLVLIGLILVRLLFAVLLPTAINRAAGLYGLTCDYERSEMNLLSGDVGLWHLTIRPATDGGPPSEPLARVGYVRGNISTLQLLRLNLDVWRAEVDGAELMVERLPDGRVPLIDRLIAALPKPEPGAPAPPPTNPAPPAPLSLAPPLKIDALRLQNAVVRLRDRSVQPEFTGRVLMDFRLSDVNSDIRPTTLEMSIWSEPGLDLLRVEGSGRATDDKVEADLTVLLRGLRFDGLGQYLAPLGLTPAAEPLSGRAAMKVRLKRADAPTVDAVGGTVTFADASLQGSAGRVLAAVEDVSCDIEAANGRFARVQQVRVAGGRFSAERNARGNLVVGGVEFTGGAPAPPDRAPDRTSRPVTAAPSTRAGQPFVWSLGELKVVDALAEFDDAAVPSGASLVAHLQELSLKKLSFDPATPDTPAELTLRATLPDIVGEATATGTVAPFANGRPVKLSLRATQIKPDRLRPYLDQLQLESQLQAGVFTAELSAGTRRNAAQGPAERLDLSVSNVRLEDVSGELLSMPKLDISGAGLDMDVPAGEMPRLSLDAVTLVGPVITVRRDAEGLLAFAGTRRTPRALAERVVEAAEVAIAAATQPSADRSGGIVLNIPPLELRRLDWTGAEIAWVDESTSPPTRFGLTDATVAIENLSIDLARHRATAPTTAPAPGTVRASLSAPGIVESVVLQGTMDSAPGRVDAHFQLALEGITGGALRPYLEPIGIAPTLTDGRLTAASTVSLSQQGAGVLRAALGVKNLAYTDGESELLGLDGLVVEPVEFGDHVLRVGSIKLDRPRASAGRDATGGIRVGGLRFDPAVAAAAPRPFAASGPPPTTRPVVVDPLIAVDANVHIGSIALADARLLLRDDATPTGQPVSLALTAGATVDNVVFDRDSPAPPPARFDATLSISDVLTVATATGTVSTAPRAVAVDAEVAANGIRGGPLSAYFPDGIEPALTDGRFAAKLSAAINSHSDGGFGAQATVRGLSYDDAGAPLARLASAEVNAERLDVDAGVFTLRTLSTRGVEANITVRPDGSPALLGVALVPRSGDARAGSAPAPATQPILSAPPVDDGEPAPPVDAATLVAAARRALPLMRLDTLDVQIDRVAVENQRVAGAAPAVLADLRMRNLNPLVWGGPDADKQPPTAFEASLRLDPLLRNAAAKASVAPFADQPIVNLTLAIEGIRGEGLTELYPPLSELLDGRRLTDGRFAATIEAQLNPDRRGGVPDYASGFGAELSLRDATYRNGSDGAVLAGVEHIHATGARVEPGMGNVIVKSLEITNPSAWVLRDREGIEVMGLLLKVLAESGNATPEGKTPDPPTAPNGVAERSGDDAAVATTLPAPPPSGGEFRVDRLIWSGLDLRVEDRTLEPPILLPVNGLDLDAAGLSTRALSEPRPIRFNLVATSGKVPLPKKPPGSGIPGALSDLGAMMGARKEQVAAESVETEDRELFSQVAASGRLTLHPAPAGWAKASVSGLELAAVRGFAEAAGVTLGGGVFDTTVDVRAKPEGRLDARTRLVFTDLKLSEPENGPIVRYLKLPAPLDVVIAAVQDADGSITLPLNVPVEQGQLNTGAVVASGVGALGQVLAAAVASAPVKAVTGVGALVGIGGGDKRTTEPQTFTLDFPVGDASVTSAEAAHLAPLVAQLLRQKDLEVTLRHELTRGDVEAAGSRANPSPADAAAIAANLRRQRSELVQRRAELAGRARSHLATLPAAEAQAAVEALRDVDRQISATDTALDAALDLLRPGADRQASRRARAAAIELGQQRLEVARQLLLGGETASRSPAPAVAAERVRIVNAGFAPSDEPAAGGRVVITLIEPKKGK